MPPLIFETLEPRHFLSGASFLPAADFVSAAVVSSLPAVSPSPSVQSLGENALPATDVPAMWPAAGSLTNAVPWALSDARMLASGGVKHIDALESGQLGLFAPLAREGHGALSDTLRAQPQKADAEATHGVTAPEELPAPHQTPKLR
ncbi:MAG: hypothetical protein HYX69_15190 [Planctomycetia bacterium]|nr:hypothetical protein [Planctomycetia bacterium]